MVSSYSDSCSLRRDSLSQSSTSDYMGAKNAGFGALLIRRPGELGAEERREVDEDLSMIEREGGVVSSLQEVVHKVNAR